IDGTAAAFYIETIREPILNDLYGRREHFDVRRLGGSAAAFEELTALIVGELERQDTVAPILAADTLENLPPLTFFEGMVLGLDGGSSERFDIVSSAIQPIVD